MSETPMETHWRLEAERHFAARCEAEARLATTMPRPAPERAATGVGRHDGGDGDCLAQEDRR